VSRTLRTQDNCGLRPSRDDSKRSENDDEQWQTEFFHYKRRLRRRRRLKSPRSCSTQMFFYLIPNNKPGGFLPGGSDSVENVRMPRPAIFRVRQTTSVPPIGSRVAVFKRSPRPDG
jgi:hypothetical protein